MKISELGAQIVVKTIFMSRSNTINKSMHNIINKKKEYLQGLKEINHS